MRVAHRSPALLAAALLACRGACRDPRSRRHARARAAPGERNSMIALRARYEATGGRFVEHDAAAELLPGVWLTGPVPRTHPERSFPGTGRVHTPRGAVVDDVPEEASLVFDTPEGLACSSPGAATPAR